MEYRPCQVKLKNGETLDNVYVQEVQSYINVWGDLPDRDPAKKYILIEDVIEIAESPNRLAVELANKLYAGGESGMGYYFYKLVLENGQTIDVCSGNAIDFISLPEGLTTKNIKDVLRHPVSKEKCINAPTYYWCLFKEVMPKTYLEKAN